MNTMVQQMLQRLGTRRLYLIAVPLDAPPSLLRVVEQYAVAGPIPGTDTRILKGQQAEKEIQAILQNLGYSVERLGGMYPFDLLVNGTLRIEVKACHIKLDGCTLEWTNRSPRNWREYCDIIILIAHLADGRVRHWILPSDSPLLYKRDGSPRPTLCWPIRGYVRKNYPLSLPNKTELFAEAEENWELIGRLLQAQT